MALSRLQRIFFFDVLTLTRADTDGGGFLRLTVVNIPVNNIDLGDLVLTRGPVGTAGADIFTISRDLVTTPSLLTAAIDGGNGIDELQITTGAIVRDVAFSNVAPTMGDVNVQNIEIITLDGGRVNRNITAATGTTGITFNLASGRADGNIIGSPRNDVFIVSGNITGDSPALDINGLIQGGGGTADEIRLITDAVVASVAFSDQAPTGGAVNLQTIETITLDGGTVNENVDASSITNPVTFNLLSGTITGDVLGSGGVDTFVIGADITIGGMIDGGAGADTLSLADGFTPVAANFGRNVLTLTLADDGGTIDLILANIAEANFELGDIPFTTAILPLTFQATIGADTFTIRTDLTGSSGRPLTTVIDGFTGTDVLQLNTRAVVASVAFSNQAPMIDGGVVNLQNIETITLNGGTVEGAIDASAAFTTTVGAGITFNLVSGRVGPTAFDMRRFIITGSGRDDIFIVSGDVTDPDMLDLNGIIDGGGGTADEVRLVDGAVVDEMTFNFFAAGELNLRNVEVITIDGGTVNDEIDFANSNTPAITFNLIAGVVGPTDATANTVAITGSGQNDVFIISGDIMTDTDAVAEGLQAALDINGRVNGGGGDQDEVRLIEGGEVDSIGFDTFVAGELSLQNIEIITIDGGIAVGIFARGAPAGVRFNLMSGTVGSNNVIGSDHADTFNLLSGSTITISSIGGGNEADIFNLESGTITGSVDGNEGNDTFVIGAGITIGGTIDGGEGDMDAVSLATGFTPASANLFEDILRLILADGSRIELTLANIELTSSIAGLTEDGPDDLTFTATTGEDTFIISQDLTGLSPLAILSSAIAGGGGTDELQLNAGAVVAGIAFANTAPPTGGAVNLQSIETITLDGGVVNRLIDASAAPAAAGVRVDLRAGRIGGALIDGNQISLVGSGGNDTFIIAGDLTGDAPALIINGEIQGGGGDMDEVQLNEGARIGGIFSTRFAAGIEGGVSLRGIEIITVNGGNIDLRPDSAIGADSSSSGVIFNLMAGTITGSVLGSDIGNDIFNINGTISIGGFVSGSGGVDTFNLESGTIAGVGVFGGNGADVFVLGTGITIGGMIDGGGGMDTLSLATGITATEANFFGGVLTFVTSDGTFTFDVVNIEDFSSIAGLTMLAPNTLRFPATAGADTFEISTDITDPTDPALPPLMLVIDGLAGVDVLQINRGATVASVAFSDQAPTEGAVHLQSVETIRLNGGTVNSTIDASAAPAGGVTVELVSGTIQGVVVATDQVAIIGSDGDDTFIVTGDTLGNPRADPPIPLTLRINGDIQGGGGDMDEFQLNEGGLVSGISYTGFNPGGEGAPLGLNGIEVITVNGGIAFDASTNTGTITAELSTTGITFNLMAGMIRASVNGSPNGGDTYNLPLGSTISIGGFLGELGGNHPDTFNLEGGRIDGNVFGGGGDDMFFIGANISIGGTIDGQGGTDTLGLAMGFEQPTSVELSNGVLTLVSASGTLTLTVINIENFTIPNLRLVLSPATAGANIFAIAENLTGTPPLLTEVIDGLGGIDELRLNAGAFVTSIAFANTAPADGSGGDQFAER